MADPDMSVFAPHNLADIEQRLALANSSECWCRAEPHENALHDLAADDVPWLMNEVRRLRARVTSLTLDRDSWEREARDQSFKAQRRTDEITALTGQLARLSENRRPR